MTGCGFPFGGSADESPGKKKDGSELSCVSWEWKLILRGSMLNFLNFGPFHFLPPRRWWLLLSGRRRVPSPSPETPPKFSGRLPRCLELCLWGVWGCGLSPAAPSHQADPATGFHSYGRARFQFPHRVLQAAVVPIAPGDAGGLLSSPILPCNPSRPRCGSSSSILGFLRASLPDPRSRSPPGSWAGMAFCSTVRADFP